MCHRIIIPLLMSIGIMHTMVYWGYIGIMEKKMETTIACWGYIGIMEKKMETHVVYCGYIGRMEKTLETTITGLSRV